MGTSKGIFSHMSTNYNIFRDMSCEDNDHILKASTLFPSTPLNRFYNLCFHNLFKILFLLIVLESLNLLIVIILSCLLLIAHFSPFLHVFAILLIILVFLILLLADFEFFISSYVLRKINKYFF